MRPGFIYALHSDNCPFIKIGRTDRAPFDRINEINAQAPYASLGPWHLLDCRQVTHTNVVEGMLHGRLADCRSHDIAGAHELFSLPSSKIFELLESIPEGYLYRAKPLSSLKVEPGFLHWLCTLFSVSGLDHFLDEQGAWTFKLMPSTGEGKRFYTLNIGPHEVAYSTLLNGEIFHHIHTDELILRDRGIWSHAVASGGSIAPSPFSTALEHAVVYVVKGSFADTVGLLNARPFRRALIAYWFDRLLDMRQRGVKSVFARFHDYNAIAEVVRYHREMRTFRSGVVPV